MDHFLRSQRLITRYNVARKTMIKISKSLHSFQELIIYLIKIHSKSTFIAFSFFFLNIGINYVQFAFLTLTLYVRSCRTKSKKKKKVIWYVSRNSRVMFSKIIVGPTKQNRTWYFQVMKEICSKYQDNILTETLTLMQTICDLYLLFSFVKKKTHNFL